MQPCTARHWASEDRCLRTQPHPGYHVGEQRIWNDEYCSDDLMSRIDDLGEALENAERTIRDMEDAADELATMVEEQSRKLARLSERRA